MIKINKNNKNFETRNSLKKYFNKYKFYNLQQYILFINMSINNI